MINKLPNTVDLNVNGVCNLDCPWCWGPEHKKEIETLTIKDWKEIILELSKRGTKSIIFTGGEPLLKKGLIELLEYSKEIGLRNTLSTNAILLDKHKEVLDFVDDIGIPLDGSDKEKAEIMRKGITKNFQKSIEAILMIKENYRNIDLTVRTVVSNKNKDDIENIGNLLLQEGVDPEYVRWKIYQCNTGGPRINEILKGGWLIKDSDFLEIVNKLKTDFSSFKRLETHTVQSSYNSRYLHILPNGDIKLVGSNENGLAIEQIIGKIEGNIENSIQNLVEEINRNYQQLLLNSNHG